MNSAKQKNLISRVWALFFDNRVPVSAAALSYNITMTFFPFVICIYTMLGHNFDSAIGLIQMFENVMPEKTYDYLLRFMSFVSENYSTPMMAFALSTIVITASAAFRTLETTICIMQGGERHTGIGFLFFSVVMALAFLFLLYAAFLIVLMGQGLLSAVNAFLPFVDLENYSSPLRYLLLFLVGQVIVTIIFALCKNRGDDYHIFFGAFVTTVGLVGVSYVFSKFINASLKYHLVYGSLAALILLMFWLYCVCVAVFVGAAVNIARRDCARQKAAAPAK